MEENRKWQYINNIMINFFNLIILCLTVYLCINYSFLWILLLFFKVTIINSAE